jgi:tol-pal system protein YbgF
MKAMIVTGTIIVLFAGILILGGCSSTPSGTNKPAQQEGSEIDQIIGISEQKEQQETPDEDEVLRLLGISKEKTEQPAVKEASTNEDQMKKDINDLEKKLTEKDSEISRLKTDIVAKEEKISKLESSASKQPATPATTPTYTGDFRQDYQNALSEYYNRSYKLAIQLFEELLARNPSTSLSDNCRYWIGECYYGLGNYNQAIIEFTKVFSFNKSNKLDDAQLKLGLCYWKLGDRERARQEFEHLISDYPNSEYVEKAQQFLSKL